MDISVLIPSIRTPNWSIVLDTLKESCKRYSYEVVFIGPFDPPGGVDLSKVTYIKSYRCPSAAAQQGAEHCKGELLYHCVDDAKFIPGAIDAATDLYKQVCGYKDTVNMRYTEDDDYSGKTFPLEFWNAHHHPPMRLPGVPGHYKIALHFLVNTKYFLELGGFDCGYEYLNFNLHDLMFRLQYDGGRIFDSPTDVTNCNHYGNRRVDHGVIEDAYPHDKDRFTGKYMNPNALTPENVRIDVNNWRNQPEVWARRFPRLFTSYEEMIGAR